MNQMNQNPRVFISVGEASGDLHASNMIKAVKALDPHVEFCGMGGKLMREAGAKLLLDSSELALIGGFEVLLNFRKILRTMNMVKRELRNNRPDLVILVDYPCFNMWLAKVAKKYGIKVLYYIAPQIWAWHKSRIKAIKKYVDMMAVVFPFEVDFYQRAGVPVAFVGHPLMMNKHAGKLTPEEAREVLAADGGLSNVNKKTKVIGLFPGSRLGEIKFLLPTILGAAKLLKEKYGSFVQFVLPLAQSLREEDVLPSVVESGLDVRVVRGDTQAVIRACDAIIATSGTVTLEITLVGVPMVIIYKMLPLNYFLAKLVVKIPHIGLCNIIAGRKIVQELIQNAATPEAIAAEISKILEDENYRQGMINDLVSVQRKLELSQNQLSKSIAELVVEQIKSG